ncbi:hypothetical protein C1I95_17385 [Micromonospora craterilacus]|uniref:Uncharacterized protein n=1 Tax=Micromonospora craterilacus TaxID=1655439 RepID=A0A2W2E2I2_9ACTN|nr:DUF6205 family protein [Micromonospora craterilacus]PZG16481.1 hypothetical protein C1I95_17385 [Micromonospora craterilacus]
MPLPTFPTLRFADINDGELGALAAWLRDSLATVQGEQARRAAVRDQVLRACLWQMTAAGPDDPRWTPQPWDAARIAAGPNVGRQGFIVRRCPDGCEQVDGQPRWELYIAGGGPVWTCLAREHLRPVAAVRRDDGMGRARCTYDCLCCMGDPRRHLTTAGTPAKTVRSPRMAYDSQVSGEITIDPPLPWAEIRDSGYLPGSAWLNNKTVKLRVVTDEVDTEHGLLLRQQAVGIVPVTEDSYNAHSLVADVQQLIDQFGGGRTFAGRLNGCGDDAGDLWRLEVRDGRAVEVQARIVWPDGSEGV